MNDNTATQIAAVLPLGRFHYGLLFWCSVIMLFDGYDLVIYGSVVPVLMAQWSLTPMQAGWLGSAVLFGMMAGAVVIGPLADRLGRRRVILGSIALASASALANTLAWDATSFFVLRFLTGVGLGGAVPNIVALMSELLPTRHKNILTTLILACVSIGAMISALVAMLIIPRFGWEATFLFGGLPLLLLPMMCARLPESLPYLLARDKQAASELLQRMAPELDLAPVRLEAATGSVAAPLVRLFREGRAGRTVLLWLGFGMCMLMVYGLNTWLPKIMVAGGYSLNSGLAFLFMLNTGAAFGSVGGGWLADRWGGKATLICFFALAAVLLCVLGVSSGALLLNVVFFLAGAAAIGNLAVIHSFAAQQYPSEIRATAVSWCSAIGRIGAVSGPALGGAMLSLELSHSVNLMLCAVPGVLAVVVIALIKPPATTSP